MIKLTLKIYLLANLTVVIFILAMTLPSLDEFSYVLFFALFSLLFTLPVIPALLLVFWLVGSIQQNILTKWILFLLFIALCSTIPTILIDFLSGNLLQFSMPAAFLGVLFQANPIHQYLINSYGKENPDTI